MLRTFLCFSCLLIADQPPPKTSPQAAPPPPPVKEAPKAATPQRIRVGGQVQAVDLTALGSFWRSYRQLNHEEYLAAVGALAKDPEDLCARGKLIVFDPAETTDRETLASGLRMEHLLWMIEHHPEWDGFSSPNTLPRPRQPENESQQRFSDAWLRKTGPDQHDAMALHNAAMHFAGRDPEYAVSLLKRAIAFDPSEKLYVERLGLLYASVEFYSQFKGSASADRPELVEEVRAILDNSSDPYLIAGTQSFYQPMMMRYPRRLPVDPIPFDRVPSRSPRFRSACYGR